MVFQLVFRSLSEGIVLCVPYVVDSVCLWEEMNSGSSYFAIFDHLLMRIMLLKA